MHKSKPQPRRKSHILIPELIKKIQPIDENKQNICSENTMCISNKKKNYSLINTSAIEPKIKNLPSYSDSENSLSYSNNIKDLQCKLIDVGLNQSTERTFNASSESQIQSAVVHEKERQGSQWAKLKGLIKSQKMFVSPDKWTEFLGKAVNDEKFQKALNIFLYSYFIQHYN